MSQQDKIFTLQTPAGEEVLAVDDQGNLFIHGETAESDDAVRAVMLKFAKQFLIERSFMAPILSVRSAVPNVLRRFQSAEERETIEFKAALLQASQRPSVEFNFEPGLLNAHVFVGLLQEVIQQTLALKIAADREAAAKASAAAGAVTEEKPAPEANSKSVSPPSNNKKKKGSR